MGRFDWLEIEKEKGKIPDEKKNERIYDENYYMQVAERSYREGDYEGSLKFYARALGCNPNLEEAWLGQVKCLTDLDELNEAKTWVDKAIEKFPQSADLPAAKSVVFAKMFEIDKAMILSDKVIVKKNPSKFVWLCRGFVLLCSNSSNASHCLSKTLEGNPQDWFWNLRIGICYLDCRKFPEAQSYLERAAKGNAGNPLIWYKMGRCFEGLVFTDRAKFYYRKALGLKPVFKNEVLEALNKIKKTGLLEKIKRLFTRE